MAELTQKSSGGTGGPRGGGNRGPGRGHRRTRPPGDQPEGQQGGGQGNDLSEKVVFINRSAKVVKGGRRFSFSALVVAGDKHGKVGLGLGKAVEVSEAIRKGGDMAKNHMIEVSLKDATIPHEIFTEYGGAKVLLRPASPGTGLIAGKTVRAVLESVGIKDVLTKSLGSNNPSNVVKATMAGLLQLRSREEIYRGRGMEIKPPAPKTPAVAPVIPAPAAKAPAVAPAAPVAPVVSAAPAPVAPVAPVAPAAGTAPATT